jgi:exosortase
MKPLTLSKTHLQLGLVLAAFLALYYPFILKLVQDWETNDNYTHGYMVPFVSAFMIWSMRGELKAIPTKPSNWGLAILAVGLLQLFVANIGSEFFLQRTSIIIVIYGISMFLFGGRVTRSIWLAIAYLIFMIPLPAIIWNRIAFPMQLFASAVTEHAVGLFGIPIFREGNVLHLAQTTLEVVDACSGLRSLVTMVALGAAFAFLINQDPWKKWVFVLAAFPIAIIVNIVRLMATAVLANRYGSEVAQGFQHDFSGILVFSAGIVLLFLTHILLSRIKPKSC